MTNKLAEIRNKVARTILMILGTILTVSVFYRHIIEGFGSGTESLPWTGKDWILLSVGFFLMLGAAYFNRLVKLLFGLVERKTSK